MSQEDPALRIILVLLLLLVLAFALIFSVIYTNFVLLLGVVIPIIVFLASFLLMSGLKRKILARLAASFGENVVKVAGAIIDYFEVPMTILLALSITLFLLVFTSLLAVFHGLDVLQQWLL